MIRLETSKRTGIDNVQWTEVSAFERNWAAEIPKRHPNVKKRTEMSALYNCHGLTFACRRTRIPERDGVEPILLDDKWTEMDIKDLLPGDIVVYFSAEGDPNHSGVVVGINELAVPQICSKWGSLGEYLHLLNDCPSMYGPISKFYRCLL